MREVITLYNVVYNVDYNLVYIIDYIWENFCINYSVFLLLYSKPEFGYIIGSRLYSFFFLFWEIFIFVILFLNWILFLLSSYLHSLFLLLKLTATFYLLPKWELKPSHTYNHYTFNLLILSFFANSPLCGNHSHTMNNSYGTNSLHTLNTLPYLEAAFWGSLDLLGLFWGVAKKNFFYESLYKIHKTISSNPSSVFGGS